MTLKFIKKTSTRLRFLANEKIFLSEPIRRPLYDAIINFYFGCAFSDWYSNLNKSLKEKIKSTPEQMHALLFEFE